MSEIGSGTRDVPACAGGAPAKTAPYGREPRYGVDELRELEEALNQGSLFYAQGAKTHELEESFARACGVRFAVACSSGTTAIHAALIASGISPGDEVITSPITDVGTIIPILFQGGIPVFADLDPTTSCLDPDSVAETMTARTRAIIAVHLGGNACDMAALKTLADERGAAVIEDCAQALGCRYAGKPVGSWGAAGCFSLNEFKHISCGDGGIVVTDDQDMAERLRLAVDKGYDRRPGANLRDPAFLALNARMTELQAAVAVAQLRRLDDIVDRRRRWCGALTAQCASIPGIIVPGITPACEPSWWFWMMRVAPEVLHADADTFASALSMEGLPVSPHYIRRCVYEYPLLAEHRAFERGGHPYSERTYARGLCPQAEAILRTCVILAVNEAYTDPDLDETVRAIRRVACWFIEGRA